MHIAQKEQNNKQNRGNNKKEKLKVAQKLKVPRVSEGLLIP